MIPIARGQIAAPAPVRSGDDKAEVSDAPTLTLPPITIVGVSPLLGTGLDRNKVPAATHVLTGDDVNRTGIPSALDALNEQTPGVALDDAQGNPFQANLVYRGFAASPLDGNAQGLAVYLNGVRFNQPFADTVNWDLLPDLAIDRINLEGANPVFGLNALGGSLSVPAEGRFLVSRQYRGGVRRLLRHNRGIVRNRTAKRQHRFLCRRQPAAQRRLATEQRIGCAPHLWRCRLARSGG